MAMFPTQLVTRYDDETGEIYLVSEHGDGTVEWMMPLKQAAQLMDYRGNRALVEEDGRLYVSPGSSMPLIGYDAAGAAAWVLMVIPVPGMRYVSATCTTNGAVLSLDGGLTSHLSVAAGTTPVFPGVKLTPGVGVYARNAVAGNYADLWVSIW